MKDYVLFVATLRSTVDFRLKFNILSTLSILCDINIISVYLLK